MKLDDYSNFEISVAIDTWIRGERDRAILKRRLIDCVCYEPLAEEFNLSVQQVKNIVYKSQTRLFQKMGAPRTGEQRDGKSTEN